jgi:hypothetical protein
MSNDFEGFINLDRLRMDTKELFEDEPTFEYTCECFRCEWAGTIGETPFGMVLMYPRCMSPL